MTELTVIPAYNENLFVNRSEEISSVTQSLDQLLRWTTPEKRTIVFRGERGIGKSWLLKKLSTVVNNEPKYAKAIIECSLDLQDYGLDDPVIAVISILKKFRSLLGTTNLEAAANLTSLSRQILEEVRETQKEKIFLLILDHVYEADWKLLVGLEDYLLGPLAIEPRTLIVLGGRGRGYSWKTPELKLKAVVFDMQPLNPDNTKRQLLKQLSPEVALRADEVFKVTRGNPLGNYLLGKYSELESGLDAFIEETLGVVSADNRLRFREYMEALCVLNAFDEERIPKMFAAYYGESDKYSTWGYREARPVREELVQASLVHWDEDKSGFVIDDILKTALEKYLQIKKPDLWQKMEEAALELYDKWIVEYPRAREFWQTERDYHQNMLLPNG